MNAIEIQRVLQEIVPAIRTGWFQKIYQPNARTLVLEIRAPGKTHRLLISCAPLSARLHFIRQAPLNPATPPAFCQFLRAHIQGARIDDVQQVPNDRLVEIRITTKEGPRSIVCELTGKSANVLILDPERRVLRDLTQRRDLIGQFYSAPPKREGGLREPQTARFTADAESAFPISAAIEAHYQNKEATLVIDSARETRLRVLKKALKKEQRRIEAWREDLARAIKYRDYARYGELLKSNLPSIKKGAERITLVDYFDEIMPEVTIPLDPTKSAQRNMDDYFGKHRKYLNAERELKPRIEGAEQGLHALRQELSAIEQGSWAPPTSPPSTAKTKRRSALDTNQASDNQRRGPFRRFLSTDGLPIFVGRNARENDELTFTLAKSDDLWLHARGTPGSHVVVRLEKGNDPPPETIRDAATLALLYSDLKKSGKGEVIFTKRKWVKKAKGQAPGAVIVTQEKSIHVNLDRKRLEALKLRSPGK